MNEETVKIMVKHYQVRKAEPSDEPEILRIARNVTDKFTRTYLGDEAVEWYINSGSCDKDMRDGMENMTVLLLDNHIIGMTIWLDNLMHLLLIDLPYHGTGAAQYLCNAVIPQKLEKYQTIKLECFDKNERGNAFYQKTGWQEYGREPDEMTGGNRILYQKTSK